MPRRGDEDAMPAAVEALVDASEGTVQMRSVHGAEAGLFGEPGDEKKLRARPSTRRYRGSVGSLCTIAWVGYSNCAADRCIGVYGWMNAKVSSRSSPALAGRSNSGS